MKHIINKIFSFILLFFVCITISNAQYTTEGKDFYVSFGVNSSRTLDETDLQVRVVAFKATTVTFTFTASTGADKVMVRDIDAGEIYTLSLDSTKKTYVYNSGTGKTNKSLRIQSTEPISVYALNQAIATTDATNVLPVSAYGVSYYHLTYYPSHNGNDGFIVIASEDNTNVYDNGVLKTTLNRGQTYTNYFTLSDNVGHNITSDHPIAYFTVNKGVEIPKSISYIDCLYQQLMPLSTWGTKHFIPLTLRGVERVRIVASHNGTVITQTGGTMMTGSFVGKGSLNLDAGEFVELEIKTSCYISSNYPIGVASFLVGSGYSGLVNKNTGDPAMAWVPPVEQFLNTGLSIAPFRPKGKTQLNSHYAIVVVPAGKEASTSLTIGGIGTPLSGGSWVANTEAGYSYYTMPLDTNNRHPYRFMNTNGMFLLGYGIGSAESYYYMAGASIRKLDISFDVNNIHYQDAEGRTFCDDQYTFTSKLVLSNLSIVTSLKWYIDGVEYIAAQDQQTWTLPKSSLKGTHTIKLVAVDDLSIVHELQTTFTVTDNLPILASFVAEPVCSGAVSVVSIVNSQPGVSYSVYDAPSGGNLIKTVIGNGGTININSPTPITSNTSYLIVASNSSCNASALVPITNTDSNKSLFTDRAWFFGTNISGEKTSPGLIFDDNNMPNYSPNLTKVNSLGTNFSTNLKICDNYNFYTTYDNTRKMGLVYNYKHEVMEDGEFPTIDNTTDGYAGAYIGNNKYAFFAVSNQPLGNLNYYIVDMNANGGNGKVTFQKTVASSVTQGIEIVAKCGTTNEYWLIYNQSTSKELRVDLLSGETLTFSSKLTNPLSNVGDVRVMVRSPQNNRIACLSGGWPYVDIFSINATTGQLVKIRSVELMAFGIDVGSYYSISFTPDNNYCVAAYGPANTNLAVVNVLTGEDRYASVSDANIVGGGPSIPFPKVGGGLKLGPDNIMYQKTDKYIFQLMWNKGGIQHCFALDTIVGDMGLNFSIGLTPPAVDPSGIGESNTAPVVVNEALDYIATPQVSGWSVTINPVTNDTDPDNDELFLSEVKFADPNDSIKGSFSINYDKKEIIFISSKKYACGTNDQIVLKYDIRDKRVLNSLCASGQIILNISTAKGITDYPDIRVTVCPQNPINLMKYIDSRDFVSVQWSPESMFFNNGADNGTLKDVTSLRPDYTYAYKYTITNSCITEQRKVYLRVDSKQNAKVQSGEIKVCYEQADNLLLDQLFGIDADGTWSCIPPSAMAYLKVNNTVPFVGAAIFNGKEAWDDVSIPFNGTNKEIMVTYTPSGTSCLSGKIYTVKIILTPDIVVH